MKVDYREHTPLLEIIIGPDDNDKMAISRGRSIAYRRSICGLRIKTIKEADQQRVLFFDYYSIKHLSFKERLRHLMRKIGAVVFGKDYMKVVITLPGQTNL